MADSGKVNSKDVRYKNHDCNMCMILVVVSILSPSLISQGKYDHFIYSLHFFNMGMLLKDTQIRINTLLSLRVYKNDTHTSSSQYEPLYITAFMACKRNT
jgi:hypothetical protein